LACYSPADSAEEALLKQVARNDAAFNQSNFALTCKIIFLILYFVYSHLSATDRSPFQLINSSF
ncbi:MAG: hypothetical protein KBF13_03075, partial [Prevotella sp.]|nr:hypothetical protein [Prevotella sp.]